LSLQLHHSPFHLLSPSLSLQSREKHCLQSKGQESIKKSQTCSRCDTTNLNPCLLDDDDGKFQIVTSLSPFSYKKRGKREMGKPETNRAKQPPSLINKQTPFSPNHHRRLLFFLLPNSFEF
jgi:hypothetical protein